MKLSKTTISELIKIAATAIVSVLTTLGVISCTIKTDNSEKIPTHYVE